MLREYYTKKACSKATKTMLVRVHAHYHSSQGLSRLYRVLSILHFQLASSSKLYLCPDLHSGSDQFVSGMPIITASTTFRTFTVFYSLCSLIVHIGTSTNPCLQSPALVEEVFYRFWAWNLQLLVAWCCRHFKIDKIASQLGVCQLCQPNSTGRKSYCKPKS